LDAAQLFVGDVLDVDPLELELLVEFMRLPPKVELLVDELGGHPRHAHELAALHHTV